MTQTEGLLTGTWRWTQGYARVLLDDVGTVRGTYDQVGATLRATRATVEGRPMTMVLSDGIGLTPRITVSDAHGRPLAAARVSVFRWRGRVELPGREALDLVGRRSGDFTVGDPKAPLLRSAADGTRAVHLYFTPGVVDATPALLPLMLLLRLYQRQVNT